MNIEEERKERKVHPTIEINSIKRSSSNVIVEWWVQDLNSTWSPTRSDGWG